MLSRYDLKGHSCDNIDIDVTSLGEEATTGYTKLFFNKNTKIKGKIRACCKIENREERRTARTKYNIESDQRTHWLILILLKIIREIDWWKMS